MASEGNDDESSEEDVEYDDMLEPPLIDQLKTILDEYPDDGQILKEIIQNAEDAEASYMKIVYDSRNVNNEKVDQKKRPFKKFFKGPALCIYNNATFTDEDWKGIRMIYKSVKELDPVKVGRFGLGFKSVFHITDCPMIISKDRLLILDPHKQNPGKRACITMELSKIENKYKKMDSKDILDALDGIFEFSKETLKHGNFSGTLFRFPLRDIPTDLSDNVYTEEKIQDLFKAFEDEAPVELLFLKCIEKIELNLKHTGVVDSAVESQESQFSVCISETCIENVREKRQQFQNHMKKIGTSIPDKTYINNFVVKMEITKTDGEKEHTDWLVSHCLKGGEMSGKIQELVKDKALSYSPYASIALPLGLEGAMKGHVFCLMPLPLQEESMTGFPVHVNGHFALSQNRRHVKWPTADQTRNKTHKDKSIRWNECLVTEVVPEVYIHILQELMDMCKRQSNPDIMVAAIYNFIPDNRRVTNHWDGMIIPFFERLWQSQFLFTANGGGKWITVDEAVFNIFENEVSQDVVNTVLHLMRLHRLNLVTVPEHVSTNLHARFKRIQTLTREYVAKLMRSHNHYKTLPTNDKLNLLQFLMEGDNHLLEGLELLPLNNNTFTVFSNSSHYCKIFICTDEKELFPGLEDVFIRDHLRLDTYGSLQRMAARGKYQLHVIDKLQSSEIARMLQSTINKNIGKTTDGKLQWKVSKKSKTGKVWLIKVWKYLGKFQNLDNFCHLNIIPCVTSHLLYSLNMKFLLKSSPGIDELNDRLCTYLQQLNIIVLQTLPKAIADHIDIHRYVYFPTVNNVLGLLGDVQMSKHVKDLIHSVNQHSTADERKQFVEFISRNRLDGNCIKFFSELKLFQERKSGKYVSTNQVSCLAEIENIPVQYHKESLLCQDTSHKNLALSLCVQQMKEEDVIIDILGHIEKCNSYSTTDVSKMIKFVMTNLKHFHKGKCMVDILKRIKFVPNMKGKLRRPADLFDPDDEHLKWIIIDQGCFPNKQKICIDMKQLRKLGLKGIGDLTDDDILKCATELDKKARTGQCSNIERDRSVKLLEVLNAKPDILCNRSITRSLLHGLRGLYFVLPMNRPSSYPTSLPWYTSPLPFCRPIDMLSSVLWPLVGSVKPMSNEIKFMDLSTSLELNTMPSVDDVIQQLTVIIQKFEDKEKHLLLDMVGRIYQFLADHCENQIHYHKLKSLNDWIWTGTKFEQPEKVYLNPKDDDLALEPYLFLLPSEFRKEEQITFFERMNCVDCQNTEILIKVETLIQEKYNEGYSNTKSAAHDLQLVISILNKLKQDPDLDNCNILFPVHTSSHGQVILKPAIDCNYCNADWLKDAAEEDGQTVFYVHEDIPHDTAAKLGVPSLTESLLEETEGVEEWGQNEPLTRRIKNLLKDYTDGFSVPKEIVQNADDAGATKVCFMYDERQNKECRNRLIHENMAECQGPALWAYNNAMFTAKDLQNITKLSGATKESDAAKIGKFGLGFCAVYNLTEVPSLISGDQIVIFDPHTKYLASALKDIRRPGIKIDLKSMKNQQMVRRMTSQFQPFQKVFGCNVNIEGGQCSYDATLFRLPLRTAIQGESSEICNIVYNRHEMKQLMKIFFEAAGNLLLFTQNVAQIEFYHLTEDEHDPSKATLLYCVKREVTMKIERHIVDHMPKEQNMSVLKNQTSIIEKMRYQGKKSNKEVNCCILMDIHVMTNSLSTFGVNGESSSSKWFISWGSGTAKSIDLALNSPHKGILPLGAVSCLVETKDLQIFRTCKLSQVPFGFYKTSHIFCYLPLPVETQLPVHINGSFAVTPDRRQLACKTTDDKNSFESMWNEALMGDAVCNAYILMLENLMHLNISPDEAYHNLWPHLTEKQSEQDNQVYLQNCIYKNIIAKKPTVFRRLDEYVPITICTFLDPTLMEAKFGPRAFEGCVQLLSDVTHMMKLPKSIRACFRQAGCDKLIKERILSVYEFFKRCVFPHLNDSFWNENNTRDEMIQYALESPSDKLFALLKTSACIPTEPHQTLKCPDEIVDRNGQVGKLFSIDDERFIFSPDKSYFKHSRMITMKKLGMIQDELSAELIINRANSIKHLASTCSFCALDRCQLLVQYLIYHMEDIETNGNTLTELKSIQFLPVLPKPEQWKWSWAGNLQFHDFRCLCDGVAHTSSCQQICFESPERLYVGNLKSIVGCILPVLNDEVIPMKIYSSSLYKKLGLKSEPPIYLVKQNLLTLASECRQIDERKESVVELTNVTSSIYQYMNDMLQDTVSDRTDQDELSAYPILFLGDTFVKPTQVVVSLTEDCKPYFYGFNLTSSRLRYMRNLHSFLNIGQNLEHYKIVEVMNFVQKQHGTNPLQDVTVVTYIKLLRQLCEAVERENLSKELIADIKVPDRNGRLTDIDELCMEIEKVNSSKPLKFTHDLLDFDLGRKLGIRNVRKQILEGHSKNVFGKSFGQRENLKTRIQGILKGYPCDVAILKELVQNADDAGASEIHIVSDFSIHNHKSLFDKSWKPLQGPAILVYNDKPFTKEDIEGIQQLGLGSKGHDATKTGQYGVGFNSVYHLTDAPSFITRGPNVETGETLCIMDPHCKYVPGATEESPGRQFLDLKELRDEYPDVFSCYHEKLLMNGNGTIFRLPLRTLDLARTSDLHLTNEHIDKRFVAKLLQQLETELSEILLFVNNVKQITISNIENGCIVVKSKVQVDLNDEDRNRRKIFHTAVLKAAKSIKDYKNPSCITKEEIHYVLNIKHTSLPTKSWLVVQRLGFTGTKPVSENVLQAYQDEELGLLPRGGVALCIPDINDVVNNDGKAFCFLPLPVKTGLPMHVNGHFALDHESRRNLWTDENEGYRSTWNKDLMADVIAPAYSTALQQLKTHVDVDNEKILPNAYLRSKLLQYHSFFPDIDKASNDYWKTMCFMLYQHIYKNQEQLLPSIHVDTETTSHVRFHAVRSSNSAFPSVFNNIREQLPIELLKDQKVKTLESLCKALGVKIIDSPMTILSSFKKSKIDIDNMTPEFLIDFLKSYENTEMEDGCSIGHINVNIDNTTFGSVEKLLICLEYCQQGETFAANMEGLPLCLRNDNTLQVFSEKEPVYCSEFADMFLESAGRFIHINLVSKIVSDEQCVLSFDIAALASFLPYTIPLETYRTHNQKVLWDPKSCSVPNEQWIHRIWTFIDSVLEKKLSIEYKDKYKMHSFTIPETESRDWLMKSLNDLLHWSLIPCQQEIGRKSGIVEYELFLMPVGTADAILNSKYLHGHFGESVAKLATPFMDICTRYTWSNCLNYLPVSPNNTCDFLEYLFTYREEIQHKRILRIDCYTIMEYLADHLKELLEGREEHDKNECKRKLKSIPLHVNIGCSNISINHGQRMLVMSESFIFMPADGIEEWARASNTLLLTSTTKLTLLYRELGLTTNESIDVYTTIILPTFPFLPQKYHEKHLKFIRDKLLSRGYSGFSVKQNELIQVIQNVEFVLHVDGDVRRACNFYDPKNSIFQAMCDESRFPQGYLKNESWNEFLKLSGMQEKLTNDMVVEFANTIEMQGRNGLTEDLVSKSRGLVSHIFSIKNVETEGLLGQIANIRFVFPEIVHGAFKEIHEQFGCGSLICFQESTLESNINLCWTTCPLLPDWANPLKCIWRSGHQQIFQQLHINKEPTPDKVVQHVQNICDRLQEMCKKQIKCDWTFIENVMDYIYTWLLNNKNFGNNQLFKDRLSQKPIVYVPKHNLFVPCCRIVKSLGDMEVKPYLLEAPDRYGRFNELFELLGMETKISSRTFVMVLSTMKQDIRDKELEGNELSAVKMSIENLFIMLDNTTDDQTRLLEGIGDLFLPTRDKKLENARQIVYSNNQAMEEAIGNDIGFHYFIGCKQIGLKIHSGEDYFRKLPPNLQPKILTDIIESHLDESQLAIIESQEIQCLKDHLSTPDCREAIVRISVYDKKVSGKPPDEMEIERKLNCIENLRIHRVQNLNITMVYKGKIIGMEHHASFYKKTINDDILYCVLEDGDTLEKWLLQNGMTIFTALRECTSQWFSGGETLLLKILSMYENPDGISKMLDKAKVPEFSLSDELRGSAFPQTGETVHPKWHSILDNSFTEFDIGEYVALLLSEEYTEDGLFVPPVYIHARIKHKINNQPSCQINEVRRSLQKYEVYVGKYQTDVRAAYDLYKFNRNKVHSSTEMEAAVKLPNSPTDNRPLEHIFEEVKDTVRTVWTLPEDERKRMIRRLYKKWHPDKNVGNESVAGEIFKFIRQLVLKLENGENIDNDDKPDTFAPQRNPHSRFWSHFETWDHDAQTDYTHQQERKNSTKCNASTRGYRNESVPSHAEARQWMKQAKLDLKAALEFLPRAENGPTFNWICYMCYQSSVKALKSLHFNIDSNNIPRFNKLDHLLNVCDEHLRGLVTKLITLVGEDEAMMFPSRLSIPRIPSDLYDNVKASEAVQITEEIVEYASDQL